MKKRIFRLFISSTFSDFLAEREALQKNVFPKLEAYCRSRGSSFQAVDLRWGITEEAQKQHDTLRICLEEIRRCQILSPKPNFVILLGDRYGWQPIPATIPIYQWNRLLEKATKSEEKIIRKNFKGPDLNVDPPVYRLNHQNNLTSSRNSLNTKLQESLRSAVNRSEFNNTERLQYFGSATHQEISLGALNFSNNGDIPSKPEDHVSVYIRKINGMPLDKSAKQYIDWDSVSNSHDINAFKSVQNLRLELEQKMPERVWTFSTEWNEIDNKIELLYINKFCEHFLNSQIQVIDEELKSQTDADVSDFTSHYNFAINRSYNFCGRLAEKSYIQNYLNSVNTSPLIVFGGGGVGKSSLISKLFLEILSKNCASVITARFVGGGQGCENLMQLMKSLCSEITIEYGDNDSIDFSNIATSVEQFHKTLSRSSSDKPLIVIIDSLDQLESDHGAWKLWWLPKKLPKWTKIILSTREGEIFENIKNNFADCLLKVDSMTKNDGDLILDKWLQGSHEYLSSAGISINGKRKIALHQREVILENFEKLGNPLWLKLAFEKACTWPSWYGKADEDKLYSDLPISLDLLIKDFISRRLIKQRKHPPLLNQKALTYLSASRSGLSEEEINYLLATDTEVRAEFDIQVNKTGQLWFSKTKLPPIYWSRLYSDLKPYLTRINVDGAFVYKWFHKEFNDQIQRLYLNTNSEKNKTHQKLANSFYKLSPHDNDLFRYTDITSTQQVHSLRRLVEQPWHLKEAGCFTEYKKLITNFGFCMAICAANKSISLITNFNQIPEQYVDDISIYWQDFLLGVGYILDQGNSKWPAHRILLQLALEDVTDSFVYLAAIKWKNRNLNDWVIAKNLFSSKSKEKFSINWKTEGLHNLSDELSNKYSGIYVADECIWTWDKTKLFSWNKGNGKLNLSIIFDSIDRTIFSKSSILIIDHSQDLILSTCINTGIHLWSQKIPEGIVELNHLNEDKILIIQQFPISLAVAQQENTPKDIIHLLAESSHTDVHQQALKRLLPKEWSKLDKNEILERINEEEVSEEELVVLSKSRDKRILTAIALCPSTSSEIIEKLKNDDDGDVKETAAYRELPKEWRDLDDDEKIEKLNEDETIDATVFQTLTKSTNWEIRQAVAQNPSTPETILRALLKDDDSDVQEKAQEALFREFPEEWRDLDDDEKIEKLQEDENIDSNIIDILSDSNNYRIRVAIARRSTTSSEIIEKLKNDDDDEVKDAVKLRLLPKEWQQLDKDETLEKLNKEGASVEVLQVLAECKSLLWHDIRVAVAQQENTPENVIRHMSKANDISIQEALQERQLPLEWRSLNDNQKLGKIKSGSVSTEVLKQIAKSNKFVTCLRIHCSKTGKLLRITKDIGNFKLRMLKGRKNRTFVETWKDRWIIIFRSLGSISTLTTIDQINLKEVSLKKFRGSTDIDKIRFMSSDSCILLDFGSKDLLSIDIQSGKIQSIREKLYGALDEFSPENKENQGKHLAWKYLNSSKKYIVLIISDVLVAIESPTKSFILLRSSIDIVRSEFVEDSLLVCIPEHRDETLNPDKSFLWDIDKDMNSNIVIPQIRFPDILESSSPHIIISRDYMWDTDRGYLAQPEPLICFNTRTQTATKIYSVDRVSNGGCKFCWLNDTTLLFFDKKSLVSVDITRGIPFHPREDTSLGTKVTVSEDWLNQACFLLTGNQGMIHIDLSNKTKPIISNINHEFNLGANSELIGDEIVIWNDQNGEGEIGHPGDFTVYRKSLDNNTLWKDYGDNRGALVAELTSPRFDMDSSYLVTRVLDLFLISQGHNFWLTNQLSYARGEIFCLDSLQIDSNLIFDGTESIEFWIRENRIFLRVNNNPESWLYVDVVDKKFTKVQGITFDRIFPDNLIPFRNCRPFRALNNKVKEIRTSLFKVGDTNGYWICNDSSSSEKNLSHQISFVGAHNEKSVWFSRFDCKLIPHRISFCLTDPPTYQERIRSYSISLDKNIFFVLESNGEASVVEIIQ